MSNARNFVIGGGLLSALTYLGYNQFDKNKEQPAPQTQTINESPRIGASTIQYDPQHPLVEIETTLGKIVVQLHMEKAPLTVGNFLNYVERGHYNGTIIHEIHPHFIAICGGYGPNLAEKTGDVPIRCEAQNGLCNKRYTVSMARFPQAIDSATSHFFFNLNDNQTLDHRGPTPDQYGFCVFGEVIQGQQIVDLLNQQQTTQLQKFMALPKQQIAIKQAKRIR